MLSSELRAEEDGRRGGISFGVGVLRCRCLLRAVKFTPSRVPIGNIPIRSIAIFPFPRSESLSRSPRDRGDYTFLQLGAWPHIPRWSDGEGIILVQYAGCMEDPWHLLWRHGPCCPYLRRHERLSSPFLPFAICRTSSTFLTSEVRSLNAPGMLLHPMRDI